MSKFCMGCMEQYDDELNICPHCGYAEGTPAAQALHMEPGSILHDRFIVGRALGYGGFGVTYIGWDALLEQKVAIKEYLPSEFSTRMPGVTQVTVYNGDKSQQFQDGLDRFVEEAKRLAKLNEIDGVVKIYDSFQENNTAYIIMEYLEGETLADRLKREKKIAPEEAVSMLLPVIQSLQVVHDHGIIHRDIAPDNLFITKDGTVKLIDFGAARYATTSHSRSLTVIIKPGYSPEEQYRSRGDQGPYTDVYAIAATLYRMITGKTPPDAMERRAYFESKEKDILKSLATYCPDIDKNTENAILNAMNVRIEDRTQTMDALAHDLTTDEPVPRISGKIRKIDLLRWPLWAKIVIPCVAVVLIVTGILFGTGVIHFSSTLQSNIVIPDGMTRVPSVVNDTLDTAAERIDDAALLYAVSGKEYSDAIPVNMVLTQDLSAGTLVAQNTMMNIVISGGAQTEISPEVMADLVYLTEEEARDIVENVLGLRLSVTYEESETVASGLVISQDIPEGASLQDQDTVHIVVSEGLPAFPMPDVVGKTEEEAKKTLAEKGLPVTTEYEYDDKVASDHVLRQSIAPKEQVSKGTEVLLTVSSGKETVKVPNVVGQTKDNAQATLKNSGFAVTVSEVNSDTVKEGNVISQTPASGTSQPKGLTVTIIVSKGAAAAQQSSKTLNTVSVKTMPNKTSYNVGETLDTTGLTLTATYSDGSTQTVSSDFTCSPTALNTAGTQKITVTYEGITTSLNVTVEDTAYQFQIHVTPLGANCEYEIISNIPEFNFSDVLWSIDKGLEISRPFAYVECVVVSEGWNYTYTITASYIYHGKLYSDSYTQSEPPVISASIYCLPNKTVYLVGESVDLTGMKIQLVYSFGATQIYDLNGGTCVPEVFDKVGTQTVVVTNYGQQFSFEVEVVVNAQTWIVLPDISPQ